MHLFVASVRTVRGPVVYWALSQAEVHRWEHETLALKRQPCLSLNSFLLTLVSIRITWGLISRFLGSTTEFPGDSDAGFGGPILIICSKVSLKSGTEHFLFLLLVVPRWLSWYSMLCRVSGQSLRKSATAPSHPPHTSCCCQLMYCQSPLFLTRQCHCHWVLSIMRNLCLLCFFKLEFCVHKPS